MVPDRNFFACPEDEIAGTTALLTLVGGRVVWAAGEFAAHDDAVPPPAMPDWSPVRRYGGYAAWGGAEGRPLQATLHQAAAACDCVRACKLHGHAHASAWTASPPTADPKGFWGALGCACWAV